MLGYTESMRFLAIGIVAVATVVLVVVFARGEEERSCVTYAHFIPQDSPEATLALELSMLSQGDYCYTLPIFDDAWQEEGEFAQGAQFMSTAEKFSVQNETYIDGDLAMVYYPGASNAGPDFLFRTDDGWVIDRTTVRESVIYNAYGNNWYVSEAAGRYIPLVEAVFAQRE